MDSFSYFFLPFFLLLLLFLLYGQFFFIFFSYKITVLYNFDIYRPPLHFSSVGPAIPSCIEIFKWWGQGTYIGEHVWSDLGHLIRSRHLFRSRAVTNLFFFLLRKRPIFLNTSPTCTIWTIYHGWEWIFQRIIFFEFCPALEICSYHCQVQL